MSPTPMQIAEAAVKAVNEGRMSQFGLNIIMKGLAADLNGNDMAKFLASPVGAVFLRPKEARTSIAREYDLQKSEGYTTAEYYQRTPGSNGDGMDRIDWSSDVEATKAYRAEKAAKELASERHNEGRLNTGSERRVSGANVNPKPLSP
jgi:hypothetical protein